MSNLPASIQTIIKAKVPTLDADVRLELRKLGEPVTYFGEDNADRRNRLISLLADRDITNEEDRDPGSPTHQEIVPDNEEFWTEGSEDLLSARVNIAHYSIARTQARLETQKRQANKQDFTKTLLYRRDVNKELSKFALVGSNILSSRAISACRFSPDGGSIALGSWAGDLKLVSPESLEPQDSDISVKTYQNQLNNKLTGLDWSPSGQLLAASNSNDNSVLLFSNEKFPKSTLYGHEGRVIHTKFHPSGEYVGLASYDYTWRLWDLAKEKELYLQEGHSKEVHALGFQKDGALVASGGLDALGMVWDLRTGRQIMTLYDHIKGIVCLDWSDNGYQLATGSQDGTIKIWDLRFTSSKVNRTSISDYIFNDVPLYTIPAHDKLVSDLTFFHASDKLAASFRTELDVPTSSTFLVSSGYDGTLKIWSADNWINVKVLKGHSDHKVMSCDVNGSGDRIVSSGWDKTVKVWSTEDFI